MMKCPKYLFEILLFLLDLGTSLGEYYRPTKAPGFCILYHRFRFWKNLDVLLISLILILNILFREMY